MFKIRRIKALQDNSPSRNLSNEFINKQGSCATLSSFRIHFARVVITLTNNCRASSESDLTD